MPINVLEDYNLTRMTMEYRRECRLSNVLQSLTSIELRSPNDGREEQEETQHRIHESSIAGTNQDLECTHLLRMEADHVEIVRARSMWKLKQRGPLV